VVLAAGALAAVAATVALPSAASAHVTVQPEAVPAGATFTVIAWRVPNERVDGATTGVRVQFPRDHPLVSATVRPKPGWTAAVKRMPITTPVMIEGQPISQAIDEIDWTGGSIGVGEFDDFEVNVGPMPAEGTVLFFPTVQTYATGESVSWIEKPGPDGKEPSRPAPSLRLGAAAPAGTTAPGGAVTASTAAAPTGATGGTDAGAAVPLAVIALVVALVSLLATIGLALRGRAGAAASG
jgi:uncharacterized protein YcnI